LANFRRRIKEIAAQSEKEEESVYRINLQLFPLSKLTHKTKEAKNEKV